jgi:pimeloyl-ACP methyl ester carboxylesterase
MRALAWIALVAGALAGVLWVGARLSIDGERRHAAQTRALPLLRPDAPPAGASLLRVQARGLEFRTRVAGLKNPGPAVLMLHGFPESSHMWTPLLEAAARAGHRAAAFDQRGYSPGARPQAVAGYRRAELEADVLAVADALGFERFHLVGHDWGAVVGWGIAAGHPDRVRTFTALSIPHPAALLATTSGPPLYIRLFRVPGLMETVMGFGGFALLDAMMGQVPAEQVAEYRAILSEPGAMTAAFDWYRALDPQDNGSLGPVSRPVLYVFGNGDMPVFVGEAPRAAQEALLTGPYRSVELDAGHWLIEERPDAVVDATLAHLAAHP